MDNIRISITKVTLSPPTIYLLVEEMPNHSDHRTPPKVLTHQRIVKEPGVRTSSPVAPATTFRTLPKEIEGEVNNIVDVYLKGLEGHDCYL